MAQPNKTKIPVGTLLASKYRITRELGRGGMAAVYEAENVDIGKRVAIKILAQELTSSSVVVERFLREARAVAAIRSPYICDVYDSGKLPDGRPLLVLELLEGESLYERMTKVRWLDVDTTVAVVSMVARGLTRAHGAHIVHRDLKPENIFVTHDEEGRLLAKILDFGLAKFYAPLEGGKQQARLTREGAVFGTPAYMSPEQVRGQGAVDHRADLWALGCIVYECLTGRTVWSTDQGVAMTFAQIASSPAPRPNALRPDLPPSFTAWFDRALHRDIERRFSSARELSDELAFALERPAHAPPLASLPPPRSSGGARIVGGQVDLVSLDFSQALVRSSPPMPPPPSPVPVPAPAAPRFGSPPPVIDEEPTTEMERALRGDEVPSAGAPPPVSVQRTTPRSRSRGGSSSGVVGRALLVGAMMLLVGAGAAAGLQRFTATSAPHSAATAGAAVLLPAQAPAPSSAPDPSRTSANAGPDATHDVGSLETAAAGGGREMPAWVNRVRLAQAAIEAGDLVGAARLLDDAAENGSNGAAMALRDHLQSAAITGDAAPCKLTGLARPRSYDLGVWARRASASHPSIAQGPRGALMAWTDGHEGPEHAYAVALDEAMRDMGEPVDVTPEGAKIVHPELVRAGERVVLAYADTRGPEVGAYLRALDPLGHIAGSPILLAPGKGERAWPAVARAPDGGFIAVWSEAGPDADDLFLRRLSPALEARTSATRVTELAVGGLRSPNPPAGTAPKPVAGTAPNPAGRARVDEPAVALHDGSLHVAMRVSRGATRVIEHIGAPIADALRGIDAAAGPDGVERTIGAVARVDGDRNKPDAPSIACVDAGCFVAWHGEDGASAAFLDPTRTEPLWRKRFSRAGSHPAVAASVSGQARIAWFEGGRLMTAAITRDGVGRATRVGKVTGDQPAPSLAAGSAPGEWYLAWLDYETGHLEPFAARVVCK